MEINRVSSQTQINHHESKLHESKSTENILKTVGHHVPVKGSLRPARPSVLTRIKNFFSRSKDTSESVSEGIENLENPGHLAAHLGEQLEEGTKSVDGASGHSSEVNGAEGHSNEVAAHGFESAAGSIGLLGVVGVGTAIQQGVAIGQKASRMASENSAKRAVRFSTSAQRDSAFRSGALKLQEGMPGELRRLGLVDSKGKRLKTIRNEFGKKVPVTRELFKAKLNKAIETAMNSSALTADEKSALADSMSTVVEGFLRGSQYLPTIDRSTIQKLQKVNILSKGERLRNWGSLESLNSKLDKANLTPEERTTVIKELGIVTDDHLKTLMKGTDVTKLRALLVKNGVLTKRGVFAPHAHQLHGKMELTFIQLHAAQTGKSETTVTHELMEASFKDPTGQTLPPSLKAVFEAFTTFKGNLNHTLHEIESTDRTDSKFKSGTSRKVELVLKGVKASGQLISGTLGAAGGIATLAGAGAAMSVGAAAAGPIALGVASVIGAGIAFKGAYGDAQTGKMHQAESQYLKDQIDFLEAKVSEMETAEKAGSVSSTKSTDSVSTAQSLDKLKAMINHLKKEQDISKTRVKAYRKKVIAKVLTGVAATLVVGATIAASVATFGAALGVAGLIAGVVLMSTASGAALTAHFGFNRPAEHLLEQADHKEKELYLAADTKKEYNDPTPSRLIPEEPGVIASKILDESGLTAAEMARLSQIATEEKG